MKDKGSRLNLRINKAVKEYMEKHGISPQKEFDRALLRNSTLKKIWDADIQKGFKRLVRNRSKGEV